MKDFGGKTVLVTGAGSGIGRSCALTFARKAANVVVTDVNRQAARDTIDLIYTDRASCDKGKASASAAFTELIFDVSDESGVVPKLKALLRQTAVDVLVNCAGIGATRPFLDTELDLLDRIFAVNFRGAFLCSKLVARSMIERKISGAIVHIGSASGARGNAGRAAYGATKAALLNLTQVMAFELAPHGIRVNNVAPGPIETPLVEAAHTPSMREAWLRELPIARYGHPEDVANAVLFLASKASSYTTGQVLYVDGGFQGAGIMA